jgi:ferredoxin
MRVVVDPDTCAVTGGCVFHAPDVFRLGDDGMLHVLQEFPAESLRAAVMKAADYCPTGAISIED